LRKPTEVDLNLISQVKCFFNALDNFDQSTKSSVMERKLRSTLNWTIENQRDISPKVGSLPVRDYSIRKPLLKITNPGSYIDTYSPWEKF